MLSVKHLTFAEAIYRAKESIKKSYGTTIERKWLEAEIRSYGSLAEGLKILAWEGSPVKGYIIVNYGQHTVTAFNCWEDKLYRWTNLF